MANDPADRINKPHAVETLSRVQVNNLPKNAMEAFWRAVDSLSKPSNYYDVKLYNTWPFADYYIEVSKRLGSEYVPVVKFSIKRLWDDGATVTRYKVEYNTNSQKFCGAERCLPIWENFNIPHENVISCIVTSATYLLAIEGYSFALGEEIRTPACFYQL